MYAHTTTRSGGSWQAYDSDSFSVQLGVALPACTIIAHHKDEYLVTAAGQEVLTGENPFSWTHNISTTFASFLFFVIRALDARLL